MSESMEPNTDELKLPEALQERLNALPKERFPYDPTAVFEETLGGVFNPSSPLQLGGFVGGTPEAIEAVQQGLLNSFEQAASSGQSPDDLRSHPIFRISKYIREPDPLILSAMQKRTDRIKELFMIEELQMALRGAPGGGSYIASGFEIEHPDFSWVAVSVDNHTQNGIQYEFYKEKPEDPRSYGDASFHVRLNYMGKRELSREEDAYSYFVGMSLVTGRNAGTRDYVEHTSLEIPEDIEPLLSSVAKTLITEELVRQFKEAVEGRENYLKAVNELARIIVAECADPVEARRQLEGLGIYDDPDNFRK